MAKATHTGPPQTVEAGSRKAFVQLLAQVSGRIREAQSRAMLTVNSELLRLYRDIGRLIDARQQHEGWGSAVIPRLARALHNELPELKGFSECNIDRMIAFHRAYANRSTFSPPVVAKMASHGAVNDRLKQSGDQPTIGLILCQEHDRLLAEYGFAGIDKPIGISTYKLTRALPKKLLSALPTVQAIEAELSMRPKRKLPVRQPKT